MADASFEWVLDKEAINRKKHGVSFLEAQQAFLDEQRIIAEDLSHSDVEPRYFCFGRVGRAIMTIRFTWRDRRIRIIGAGYWRKGKRIYERENGPLLQG